MEKKLLNGKNAGGRYEKTLSNAWGIFWFLLLIFIDQITKLIADVYFIDYAKDPSKVIVLIPGMIELCMSYNRGIAFGTFAGSNDVALKIGIVAGTAVLMLVIAILFFKADYRRKFLRFALVFVIAGGVGNLIDRVYYRVWDPATAAAVRDGVRDMVRVKLIFDFGVCNFADFFIVGGGIALLFALLFFDRDALCPLGKKYKALAKEEQEKEERKAAEKKAKKQAQAEAPQEPQESQESQEPQENNG